MVELSLFESLLALVVLLLSELVDFGLAELYRSEYQPPPLSTNPVPPEIWRLAVD